MFLCGLVSLLGCYTASTFKCLPAFRRITLPENVDSTFLRQSATAYTTTKKEYKVKFTLEHGTKAQRGSIGIALLCL